MTSALPPTEANRYRVVCHGGELLAFAQALNAREAVRAAMRDTGAVLDSIDRVKVWAGPPLTWAPVDRVHWDLS